MARVLESAWAIRCVWLRYFGVYRKSLVYALLTTFVEPLLYLAAFGYGLGGMVGTIEVNGTVLSYREFVFAGIVGQTLLFQGFFESAYGSFVRMYYQRIFQAIAVTPITLSEVLWGELIWDASKATLAAAMVLVIGVAVGDFSALGALAALPFCFAFALIFAGVGLWVAARAKSIEEISYPQYILIFPMFLFCAVFFPLANLPEPLQSGVWLLPLTSVVAVMRGLLLDLELSAWFFLVPALWLALCVPASRWAMTRRLVK